MLRLPFSHALVPIAVVGVLLTAMTSSGGPAAAAPNRPTTFVDTFDGAAGSSPDASRWRFLNGPAGNGELQTYTDRAANAQLDGRGHLVITARSETYTGPDGSTRDYTSARLISRSAVLYGTVAARIKLTGTTGAWPAFWTLGANMAEVGWPRCGEIDVMEAINGRSTLYGSVHGPRKDAAASAYGSTGQVTPAQGIGQAWHTYAISWTPTSIRWLMDGVAFRTVRKSDLSSDEIWSTNNPQNLLLNVAVGGWADTPDPSVPFTATMTVDWVRVTGRG